MTRRCWAVSWDHQYRVYAARMELARCGTLRMVDHLSNTAGDLTFDERLRGLLAAMDLDEDEMLALGGYFPGCAVIERVFPHLQDRELHEAVTFASVRSFPGAPENLRIAWRAMPRPDGSIRVRIMAVDRGQLDKLLTTLRAAGVKADLLWHPFMAIDPELDSREIFLPFVEPECVFRPAGPDGLRSVALIGGYAAAPAVTHLADIAEELKLENVTELPLAGAYPSAALLAAALLRNRPSGTASAHDPSAGSALLSSDTTRRRFRKFRHNIIYLSLFCMVALLAVMVKSWVQQRESIARTGELIRQCRNELSEVRREAQMLDTRRRILGKFTDSITSETDTLGFLYRLTSTLPDNMYVTGFSSMEDRINVTVIYSGEQLAFLDQLGSISGYKLTEDTKIIPGADGKNSTAQVGWIKASGGAAR
ncbi:MAG: hypothetical protein AB7F40_06775 [Victivallaceae bacterium]|nr:hypothetical protein [Victivallaceae bacterium]